VLDSVSLADPGIGGSSYDTFDQAMRIGGAIIDVEDLILPGTGRAASVSEGRKAAFTGVAVDPGINHAVTYRWLLFAPDGEEVLSGGDRVFRWTPSDNPEDSASYRLRLVVTDDAGASAASEIEISVVNVKPKVAIVRPVGVDIKAVSEGTLLKFGSQVKDPAGDLDAPYAYVWSVERRNADKTTYTPITSTLADESGSGFSGREAWFRLPDEGVYRVRVTAVDADGAKSTAASVSVIGTNAAPTAEIQLLGDAVEGRPLTLSALARDPGTSDALGYEWSIKRDGDADFVPLASSVPSLATFTPKEDGRYTVRLKVTDSARASFTTDRVLEVENAPPDPRITVVSGATRFVEGTPYTLRVDGPNPLSPSSIDPGAGNDPLSYLWEVRRAGVEGAAGLVQTGQERLLTLQGLDPGEYVVTVRVADDGAPAAVAEASPLRITVEDYRIAAEDVLVTTVNRTRGTKGPSGVEGDVFSFTATPLRAKSTDAYQYEWRLDGPGGPQTQSGDSKVFVPRDAQERALALNDGAYRVSLVVTDDEGNRTSVLDAVSLALPNVAPVLPDPGAPFASAIGLPTSVAEGSRVNVEVGEGLRATIDPGVGQQVLAPDRLTYLWQVFDDANANGVRDVGESLVADGSGERFSFLTPGVDDADTRTYTVALTVTDDDGASAHAWAPLAVTARPGVIVSAVAGSAEEVPGGSTASYTVRLASKPASTVKVRIEGDAEVAPDRALLTFTADNWSRAQTVVVSARPDAEFEGRHAGVLYHRVESADPDYAGAGVPDVVVEVIDDEVDPLSVQALSMNLAGMDPEMRLATAAVVEQPVLFEAPVVEAPLEPAVPLAYTAFLNSYLPELPDSIRLPTAQGMVTAVAERSSMFDPGRWTTQHARARELLFGAAAAVEPKVVLRPHTAAQVAQERAPVSVVDRTELEQWMPLPARSIWARIARWW
jgi:hypothetical protein